MRRLGIIDPMKKGTGIFGTKGEYLFVPIYISTVHSPLTNFSLVLLDWRTIFEQNHVLVVGSVVERLSERFPPYFRIRNEIRYFDGKRSRLVESLTYRVKLGITRRPLMFRPE